MLSIYDNNIGCKLPSFYVLIFIEPAQHLSEIFVMTNQIYKEQLINFFKKIDETTKKLIEARWPEQAEQEKEKARYGYILSKHRVLLLRQLQSQMQRAFDQIANIRFRKNVECNLNIINRELLVELEKREKFLIEGLKGHPDEASLLRDLTDKMQEARENPNKTPAVFMEIEGKLAFRLEYDSKSEFTKTGYNELTGLYTKIAGTPDLTPENLEQGAKLVASWMINRSLPDELPVAEPAPSNEANSAEEIRVERAPASGAKQLNAVDPIAEYRQKLVSAKFKQYAMLQRTFMDITEKTKSSYRKDLVNSLVDRFIPDTAVMNKFFRTSIRAFFKNALDPDLHKIFVLMMEGDTDEGVTLELLNRLKAKYFDIDQKCMTPELAQQKMLDFLSELTAILAETLHQQMKVGGNYKKPLLTKHLNNLMRKYDHPYRIGKTKVDQEKDIYKLALVERKLLTAQEHTMKTVVKPWVGLGAVFMDIFMGLGAGALTAAAVLALSWGTLPVALFIGFCGMYVNYKLYHRFFKPFINRVVSKGLFDALFGHEAPLNDLKAQWDKRGTLGRIALVIVSALGLGLIVAPIVLGYSALVAFATMNSIMVTAAASIAGLPILLVGAAFVAVIGLIITFVVHLPVVLTVTMGFLKTIANVAVAGLSLIYGKKDDSLLKRIAKGVVIVPAMALLAVPIAALIKANIMTIEEFQRGTALFGKHVRRLFGLVITQLPSKILAILAVPGLMYLSLTGLFDFSTSILKGLKRLPEQIKTRFMARKAKSNTDAVKAENPWKSKFHRFLGVAGYVVDGGALAVNGLGNGLIAADVATSRREGIVITAVGALSSFCSCILGFFGMKKANMGDNQPMKEVENSYRKLQKKLAKSMSVEAQKEGGSDGEKSYSPKNHEEAQGPASEALAKGVMLKNCHQFFEKRRETPEKREEAKNKKVADRKDEAIKPQEALDTTYADYVSDF